MINRHHSSLPIDPASDDKRKKGRLRCELLVCELGQVVNMSASGLRVRCDEPPDLSVGQETELTLRIQNETLPVKVKVEWIKEVDRHHEVGFEFMEVTPELAFNLMNLARTSMARLMS